MEGEMSAAAKTDTARWVPLTSNDSDDETNLKYYSAEAEFDTFYDCKSDTEEKEERKSATAKSDASRGNDSIKEAAEPEAPCNAGPSSDRGQKAGEYFVDETCLSEAEALISEEERIARKEQAILLKEQGNQQFKESDYQRAALTYTEALRSCPPSFKDARAIMYGNRAACFVKMEMLKEALDDCSTAVDFDPTYLKALRRRAQINASKEEWWDNALADYKLILQAAPDDAEARRETMRLPPLIDQRNERTKAEMLSKLKELGNMVLKPFGLSTNNFKMEQNPDGSYAVKLQR